MADDAKRAMLAGALDRLHADLLKHADEAGLSPDSAYRVMVEKTINTLRNQLDQDPAALEDAIRDHSSSLLPKPPDGS